jgi:hypothetical protein
MGEDWQNLKEWFDWLTDEQLQTALAYYAAYPAEIDERLEREESRTPERVWATYPFMKPPWR